jgi:hypothetical protein
VAYTATAVFNQLDPGALLIALAAAVALFRFNASVIQVIAASALAGLLLKTGLPLLAG